MAGQPPPPIPLAPPLFPCSRAQAAAPLGFHHFAWDPDIEYRLGGKKWQSASLARLKREGFWGNRLQLATPDEPFLVLNEWDLLSGVIAGALPPLASSGFFPRPPDPARARSLPPYPSPAPPPSPPCR